MRDRINAFATVVGNLQPILAQVPTFIERAAMSADPEEEDVLMSDFEQVIDAPTLRLSIEEMTVMDLSADIASIKKPIISAPFTPISIEQLFTTSTIFQSMGIIFSRTGEKIWQLTYKGQSYKVTFYPEVFDEMPSLRLMNFGDALFEELLQTVG